MKRYCFCRVNGGIRCLEVVTENYCTVLCRIPSFQGMKTIKRHKAKHGVELDFTVKNVLAVWNEDNQVWDEVQAPLGAIYQ